MAAWIAVKRVFVWDLNVLWPTHHLLFLLSQSNLLLPHAKEEAELAIYVVRRKLDVFMGTQQTAFVVNNSASYVTTLFLYDNIEPSSTDEDGLVLSRHTAHGPRSVKVAYRQRLRMPTPVQVPYQRRWIGISPAITSLSTS